MSSYILPVLFGFVVIYGLIKKVDVYQAFVAGAKEALKLILQILPYMAAIFIALHAFRDCGALGFLVSNLAPVTEALGMPSELLPLAILKPFSGSASLGIVADLIATYGPDSFIAFCACVMMGSSETIFYTLSLYFGSVGITKIRYSLLIALISGLVGIVTAVTASYWFWRIP